jgi:hypothetical protein
MVAVRSEGGGVEVDGGSATMIKSLRKRTTVACFEVGVEAVASCRAEDGAVVCSELGSRTVGGGGGAVVSMAIADRERARGRKFSKCGEREHGSEILVWGT